MFKKINIYHKEFNDNNLYKLVVETDEEQIFLDYLLATKTYTVLFKEFEDLKEAVEEIIEYNKNENLLFHLHGIKPNEVYTIYTINDMKKHFGKAIWKSEKDSE